MSDRMQTGAALEQLREVASILRELSNAGPRDNSFKQWRQVTLTLLQRIWPDDQGRAARFRRIPFSPPSSRADSKTIRECYERGCCEAIAYLDSLVDELEKGSSRRTLVRPAEAPLREIPPREQSPAAPSPQMSRETSPPAPETAHLSNDPEFEGPRTQTPFTPVEPPAPPAPAAAREPAAPAPPPRPAPAAPAHPKPAPARVENGRTERRAKPRLKDMLGFSDEDSSAQHPGSTPASPAPRPSVPTARPAPAAPPPPPPAPAAPPPPPEPRRSFQRPQADDRFMVQPLGEEPIEDEPILEDRITGEPMMEPIGEETTAEEPAWSAPVIPIRDRPSAQGRVTTYSPTPPADEPAYDGTPEEVLDLGFDLGPEPEIARPAPAAPQSPPTTLREMLDRAAVPSVSAPSRSAREVLAMASAVDTLGVPPQRRAIVCAALIDLGHQMEAPPVQWAAIRQALAFMMDYPQIARRVLPMLMPYLDEAA